MGPVGVDTHTFAQIVECGSLAEAARALGMPPNTVSRRLSALEARLDTTVVYRTTRSLAITESGRTLLWQARRILEEVEATETALTERKRGLQGLVRISVLSVVSDALVDALGPLMSAHPNLKVQVSFFDRGTNLAAAGVDVALISGHLPDSTLVARKLFDVEMVLAASEAYLERCGFPLRPSDLQHHTTLSFLSDPPFLDWVLFGPDGGEHRVPVDARLEASDGRTLMDALAKGVGIGLPRKRPPQGGH